jgi:hypothetical protein
MRSPFTSSMFRPAGAPEPRSRAAIERTLSEGIRAISDLEGFEDTPREAASAVETGLINRLSLEVLLDLRDLVAECAWRLSDLVPKPKNREVS